MNPRTCLPVVAFLMSASAIGVMVRGQAPGARTGDSASNLRNIGQAILMYANDNKGHVPPDLGKLAKYLGGNLDILVSPRRATLMPDDVRAKPEASAEWFNARCDYVLTVPPGTRLSRLREPNQFPLVVEKPSLQDEGTVAVLYADGHVVEYARRAPGQHVEPATSGAGAGPAASRPTPMIPMGAPPPNADAVVGKLPDNLAAALAGSWRITGDVEATYTFSPDGTFTLSFPASGEAKGTWKLDGKQIVMTNTASTTPFTVIGEQETAEVAGVTDAALALRTINRKGDEEVLVFAKAVPFAKGKHDNPKIIGTWQSDNLLLVLAESGLFVMNAGTRNVKGQWAQHGDKLTIVFDVPAVAAGTRRIDREPKSRETSLTIDLVNDTTLVLTGPMLQRGDAPATFLRVK